MNTRKFKEYDRLINTNTEEQFRILSVFDGNVITCLLNTSRLEVFYFTEKDIADGIESGLYEIETDRFSVIDPQLYFANKNEEVRQTQIERFNKAKAVCYTVYEEYRFKLYDLLARRRHKEFIQSICDEYGMSRQTFWKYFTRYLQSGLQDIALTDNRKLIKKKSENRTVSAGKKKKNGEAAYLVQESDLRKFRKHLKRYLNSEVKSKEEAYLDMIDEDYSVNVKSMNAAGERVTVRTALPQNQRPTRRQFFYYISKNSTPQERKEAKETASAVRNNARVFTGTVMDGVRGPGHYAEIDAQEMDIALVSEEYPQIPVQSPEGTGDEVSYRMHHP